MLWKKLRVTLICTLVLFATAARAATLNVGPGQTYTTIQSAINAAGNGDTVLVAPGTYYENIDFLGKAITVTSSAGAATTILDGSKGQNPAVIFRNNEGSNSIFNGFTVQGGGFDGSPVPAGNYGTSGIVVTGGTPVISNNILTHNFCNSIESSGSPLIEHNEIDNTLDHGYCGSGGGSAIWLFGSLSVPQVTVLDNLIQNNTLSGLDFAGGNGGAGIAVWGAYAAIIGNTIRNNKTLGDGGAILSFNTDYVVVLGNLIYGNQASTDGAISLLPPGNTVGPFIGIVGSNTIYGNMQTASLGGPFADAPSTQVYLSGNLGQYLLINNIIVGSGTDAVAVGCGSTYNYLSITPLVFDHNDLYNANGAAYGGACPDQTGAYGNLSKDPLFSSPATNDFTLRSGSPAIDAGDNSAPMLQTTDINGSARIQDSTGLGYPVADMGAYETAGVQDASPTFLTLTPSSYSPNGNPNPPFVLTATATSALGTPTGPVTFYEDLNDVGTVNLDTTGTATLQPPMPTPGVHAFVATLPAQGSTPPSVSVKFYVLFPKITPKLTLTSSPNPSFLGGPVLFTVTISSPDNSVLSPITLTDVSTNTVLATLTPNSAGVATFTTSSLALGYHVITAAYAGDSQHNSASVSVNQDVIPPAATSMQLTCTPLSVPAGSTALLDATVTATSGTPNGAVSFTDNGAALGTLPVAGINATTSSATWNYISLIAGTHNLTANYAPGLGFDSSSASCTETVTLVPTTSTLSIVLPKSPLVPTIQLTATVVPVTPVSGATPTGTVNFYETIPPSTALTLVGTVPLSPSGVATLSVSSLPTGTNDITCIYSGDATFAPSQCPPLIAVINPGATVVTLNSSANPTNPGSPITFTLHLLFNGLPAPANQSIKLTYNPTGTAQIVVPLLTDATGTATYTIAQGLPVGSYLFAATFAATSSQSADTTTLTQVVNTSTAGPPDFTLTGPSAITFLTTTTNATQLTLASSGGFTANIALTCSATIPQYVCSVTPASVPLPANGSALVTLNLHWVGLTQADRGSARRANGGRAMMVALLPLSLLGFLGARRRRLRNLLGLLCLAALASVISACSTASYPTIFGSYPVTVTATGTNAGASAPTTHTLNITAQIVQ